MKSVQTYNGLNGVVSRQDLEDLAQTAKTEEQEFIHNKVKSLLQNFPEDKKFDIELTDTLMEEFPKSCLNCLDSAPEDEDAEDVGLGKAVSPNDIYQMITDKMISLIEKSTGKGYKTKWKQKGYMIPFNFVSKKPYRGINQLMLSGFGGELLDNPFYLTFKQVEKLGGKVKKGSKGQEVIYYNFIYQFYQNSPELRFKSSDRDKFKKWAEDNKSKINVLSSGKKTMAQFIYQNQFAYIKYYNLFSGSDVEGIDFDLENFKIGFVDNGIKGNNDKPVEMAEAIVESYPKPKVKLKHKKDGAKAFYNFVDDYIELPNKESFESVLDYYRTLFHEMVHSTGAKKRLDREIKNKFGTPKYAKEELVAEFGAVFLSAFAGIMWRNNNNHSEYIAGWKKALKHLKDDNKLLISAASDAQKASDFILQNDAKGVPEFINKILAKKETKKSKTAKKQDKTPEQKKDNQEEFDTEIEFQGVLKDRGKESVFKKGEIVWFKSLLSPKGRPHKSKITKVHELEKNDPSRSVTNFKYDLKIVKSKSSFEKRMPTEIMKFEDGKPTKKSKTAKKQDKTPESEILKLSKKTYIKNKYISKTLAQFENTSKKDLKEIVDYAVDLNKKIKGIKNHPVNIVEENTDEIIIKQFTNRTIIPKDEMIKSEIAYNLFQDILRFKNIKNKYDFDSLNYKQEMQRVKNELTQQIFEANYLLKSKPAKKQPKPKPTPKVDANGQYALLGAKEKQGLKAPAPKPTHSKNSKVRSMANRNQVKSEFFNVPGEVGHFLQAVERKPVHSVVITMDGQQGAGKTTALYKFMNAFASGKNPGLFLSLEEHPDSSLARDKEESYIDPKNRQYIDTVGEVDSQEELYELIADYDIIYIDSWQKLQRMVGKIMLDEDLRKKFDGKVFVVIFQQTTTGRTKGGAEVVFDGDIIIKMVKEAKFEDNYAFFDKNRYTKTPLEQLRYNIAGCYLYNPKESEAEPDQDDNIENEIENSGGFTTIEIM